MMGCCPRLDKGGGTGACSAPFGNASADGATGRIIGRIVDAGTNQPIEGASVRLGDFERFNRVTDSRGGFIFTAVPNGVREIAIEHIE